MSPLRRRHFIRCTCRATEAALHTGLFAAPPPPLYRHQAMDSVAGRVSRWMLASSELPEYRCPVRLEVYQRWVAFLNSPVASPAASATAATSTDAAGSMATAAAGVPPTKSAGAGAEAAAGSVPPAAQQRRQPEKTPPTARRVTEPLGEGIGSESTDGAAAAAAAVGGRGEGGEGRESSADRLAIGAEAEAAQLSPTDTFGGGAAADAAVDRGGREESKGGERGTGSGGTGGASGDVPIDRPPFGEVQYMESLKTANLASVEGVKLFFSGWVEPGECFAAGRVVLAAGRVLVFARSLWILLRVKQQCVMFFLHEITGVPHRACPSRL